MSTVLPTPAVSGKKTLAIGKKAKQDEFYTRLSDISDELKHYKAQLHGKIIFCNCDDPYESNFFKYFALNFNALGLKKLIATSYIKSPIVGGQLPLLDIEGLQPEGKEPYAIEINAVPDHDGSGATDLADVEYLLKHDANTARPLHGDSLFNGGDFRSQECIEYLKEADVIVTNPPFSLFREYVGQLTEFSKEFIIIGNTNAITYKDVFRLIKENKLRTGNTNFNVGMFFEVPSDWEKFHHIDEATGKKIARVSTSCWFTNLSVKKHNQEVPLYRRYDPLEYPKYDNYDAIEVGKVAEIPADYDGLMGVPITFLDKYNPEQFEILGWTRGIDEFDVYPTKRYVNPKQVKPDGTIVNGGKVNTGPNLLSKTRPASTYYTADNADGYLVQLYMRIIIKRRA
jgi:hypothetical protein